MKRVMVMIAVFLGIVSLSACATQHYMRVQKMAPVAISQPAPPAAVSLDKQKKQ